MSIVCFGKNEVKKLSLNLNSLKDFVLDNFQYIHFVDKIKWFSFLMLFLMVNVQIKQKEEAMDL